MTVYMCALHLYHMNAYLHTHIYEDRERGGVREGEKERENRDRERQRREERERNVFLTTFSDVILSANN